jgi:hypothetical protein
MGESASPHSQADIFRHSCFFRHNKMNAVFSAKCDANLCLCEFEINELYSLHKGEVNLGNMRQISPKSLLVGEI